MSIIKIKKNKKIVTKDKKKVTAKNPITINISIDDIIRYYICIKILNNVSISKHK